jgi:hypothetical protein
MAHKAMELMDVSAETQAKAHELIEKLQGMVDAGTPPSEGQVKKLNDLF